MVIMWLTHRNASDETFQCEDSCVCCGQARPREFLQRAARQGRNEPCSSASRGVHGPAGIHHDPREQHRARQAPQVPERAAPRSPNARGDRRPRRRTTAVQRPAPANARAPRRRKRPPRGTTRPPRATSDHLADGRGGAAATREHLGHAPARRQREAYGGINWGAAFFGWLVAVGLGSCSSAMLAAAGAAIGLTEVSRRRRHRRRRDAQPRRRDRPARRADDRLLLRRLRVRADVALRRRAPGHRRLADRDRSSRS